MNITLANILLVLAAVWVLMYLLKPLYRRLVITKDSKDMNVKKSKSASPDERKRREKLKAEKNICDYFGTMKWFNVEKGYGFINVKGNRDFFAPLNELRFFDEHERNQITRKGAKVCFNVEKTKKGLRAKNVHLE
jgi:cold shock protein